jgi:hypothetical protein
VGSGGAGPALFRCCMLTLLQEPAVGILGQATRPDPLSPRLLPVSRRTRLLTACSKCHVLAVLSARVSYV